MTVVRLEVPAGTALYVTGPLKAMVTDGAVLILGAIFTRGEEFSVARYRSYVLRALEDSRISIVFEGEASIEPVSLEEDVTGLWVSTVDELLRKGCRRFIVLGPTDAGKSSLTALISNRALLRGFRVGVVDADIGQADIGPPGFVSAAEVSRKILWLRELRAKYFRLIGSITPQRFERRIVAASVELGLKLLNSVNVLVVDTDGWIEGPYSLEYKADIARFLALDAAIAVGVNDEHYSMMLSMLSWLPCGVVRLPSPSRKRVRSREDRRMLRAEAYRRYLEKGYEIDVNADTIPVQGSCILSVARKLAPDEEEAIRSIAGDAYLAGAKSGDTYYLALAATLDEDRLAKLSEKLNAQIVIVDAQSTHNILASVVTEDLNELPALVVSIDYKSRRLRLRLPRPLERPRAILLSSIRLRDNYTEAGRPHRCIA